MSVINGQLSSSEYTCIDNLIKRIGQESSFGGDYCSVPTLVTCSGDHVTRIIINSISTNKVTNSYLNCFQNIDTLTLTSFSLDQDVFYLPLSTTLKSLTFNIPIVDSPFSMVQPFGIQVNNFNILFKGATTVSPIKISQFENVKLSLKISQETKDLIFINDYPTTTPKIIDKIFYLSSKNVPNFSGLQISSLTLDMGSPGFNESSYEYLTGLSMVKELQFELSGGFASFPTQLLTMDQSNKIEKLSFQLSVFVNSITSKFDFSKFTKLETLTFKSCQNILSAGEIPIEVYPPNLKTFSFIDNGLINYPSTVVNTIPSVNFNLKSNGMTGIGISTFSGNVKSLDLSDNAGLQGSVDNSFCRVNLLVTGNNMGGVLPDCILCHLYNNEIKNRFIGNNFDLTPIPNCISLIPKMKLENGKTKLYGKSLGFIPSSITTTPSIQFDTIVPSESFYSNYSQSTLFNVIFTSANSKQFTLSNNPYYPTPISYQLNSSVFIINGEYFSYDPVVTTITLNGVSCPIIDTTFNRITCSTPTLVFPLPSPVTVNLKVEQLTSKFIIKSNYNQGDTVVVVNCPGSCSRHGECDFDTQKCTCDPLFAGLDCSVVAKDCNDPTCGGIGVCDRTTGTCNCGKYFTGGDCSIISHWISAIESIDELGGKTVLSGWFGDTHTSLSITIGGLVCQPTLITNETIECIIGPGKGTKDVIIIQNSITWIGKSIFQYFKGAYSCANNCVDSDHGICDPKTSICTCKGNWVGFDCSSLNNNQTNVTITDGGAIINNENIEYSISIYKLYEIDFEGITVSEHTLSGNWSTSISTPPGNSKILSFTQQISNSIGSNVTCLIEQISQSGIRSFAGIEFQVESNSIKLSISITNYPFKSNLNHLKLSIKSNADNSVIDDNDCNPDTNIQSTINDNSLNYITISKSDKVLKARLVNRILSDTKPTFITSNTTIETIDEKDYIIVSLNLPHCTSECLIDPDFSLLISPTSSSCKSRKWVIPVAVVVSFVGVALIIAASIVLYKKNRTAIQIKLKTFKEKSSKNYTRK